MTWMCFSHHPHYHNTAVSSSFHPYLPPVLPFPSPAITSAEVLKGCFQLFPKQHHFGATQLIPDQSSSSILISGWVFQKRGMGFPFFLFVSWENVVEVTTSQLCPSGRIYPSSFQHHMFSNLIIICISCKIMEAYCSSCSELHCSDWLKPFLSPCLFYFPLPLC